MKAAVRQVSTKDDLGTIRRFEPLPVRTVSFPFALAVSCQNSASTVSLRSERVR
jgi:hypothetical protein